MTKQQMADICKQISEAHAAKDATRIEQLQKKLYAEWEPSDFGKVVLRGRYASCYSAA